MEDFREVAPYNPYRVGARTGTRRTTHPGCTPSGIRACGDRDLAFEVGVAAGEGEALLARLPQGGDTGGFPNLVQREHLLGIAGAPGSEALGVGPPGTVQDRLEADDRGELRIA